MLAVRITSLSKSFGKNRALHEVSLDVPPGSIYGLIGPNGSGKTTMIKSLVGASKPDSGKAEVLGLDPLLQRWELRKQIGYMPQVPALYGDLSARNNILFFASSRRIKDAEERVTKILSFTGLSDRASDPVRTFSGGMQKRVSLACAMIHEPRILFLDEPTAAVDPELKRKFWELFRKLADSGVTIFVSTHLMDEAMLCDRVTILKDGEILLVDTPQNILAKGKMKISFVRSGEKQSLMIPASPEALVIELQKLGLGNSVSELRFESDSIEEVVLSMIQKSR